MYEPSAIAILLHRLARKARVLLAMQLAIMVSACTPEPKAEGNWTRLHAYGDEISYLNTRYLQDASPIIAETLDIWRPEPAFTYQIKDHRAFWCNEGEVALLERWVAKNGGPFEKRAITDEMRQRKPVRDFDVRSNTLAAPPNQIAALHRKVCSRAFGERLVDPLADFERQVG